MVFDNKIRSVYKSITWRILATFTTVTLVFVFTNESQLALNIGVLEIVSKMFLYFLHERMWNHVNFGTFKTETRNLLEGTIRK
jgi:adenylylsulfate kinase